MFKVTGSRLKVESGSDHDVAQLNHGRNICAKFELLGHRDLAGQSGSHRRCSKTNASTTLVKSFRVFTLTKKNMFARKYYFHEKGAKLKMECRHKVNGNLNRDHIFLCNLIKPFHALFEVY